MSHHEFPHGLEGFQGSYDVAGDGVWFMMIIAQKLNVEVQNSAIELGADCLSRFVGNLELNNILLHKLSSFLKSVQYNRQAIGIMNLIRRIGTLRHKFKLEFFIKKLSFNRHVSGQVYISIRRGTHKVNSEALVEMDKEHVCNFKNQILTFDAVTLFYDESDKIYQEKPGEMKIVLKTSNGDKKLLGILPFDVGAYANEKKENLKFKRSIEETPAKLDAQIEFQIYIKFMGEASETDKSTAKDQKRGESPFDKISNFFSGLVGNTDQQEKKKIQLKENKSRVNSPRKKEILAKERGSAEANGKSEVQSRSNARDCKEKKSSDEDEKPKERHRQNNGMNNSRSKISGQNGRSRQEPRTHKQPEQPIKPKKSTKRRNQQPDDEEQALHSRKGSTRNNTKVIQPEEDCQENEQSFVEPIKPQIINKSQVSKKENGKSSEISKKKDHYQSQKNLQSDKEPQKNFNPKNSRNLIDSKKRDTLTQYDERKNEKSQYNNSQGLPAKQTDDIFFKNPPKPSSKQAQAAQMNFSKNKPASKEENDDDYEQLFKKNENKSVNSSIQSKKVKQNTIHINNKKADEDDLFIQQMEKRKETNIFGVTPERRAKKAVDKPEDEKTSKAGSRKDVTNDKKSISNASPLPKERIDHFKDEEIDNLFDQFELNGAIKEQPKQIKQIKPTKEDIKSKKSIRDKIEPTKLEDKIEESPLKNKKTEREDDRQLLKIKQQLKSKVFLSQKLNIDLEKYKEEVSKKSKEIKELKDKLALSQSEDKERQQVDKILKSYKKQKDQWQEQLQKLKNQNNTLKSQVNNTTKNQSFFRETSRQFEDQSQDADLQQQIRRLQKEKNEQLIINQQEKDKYRREIKKANEQLEKERLKYKQLEDISKADLKKLKDQILKLNSYVQSLKSETQQKSRENSILIDENKKSNETVIEMRDKLAAIKMKICEKLNEANEKQEAELMEVLTDLSEDM